jgi:hypothetical protein
VQKRSFAWLFVFVITVTCLGLRGRVFENAEIRSLADEASRSGR